MTDTSSPDTLVVPSSLQDVLSQADSAACTVKDRWLGKRIMPRTALATPVWVGFPSETGFHPPVQMTLRDVSRKGIGLYSHRPMETGDVVLVRFSINEVCWSGPMRVRHCTETVGGFKVGLEAIEQAAEDQDARPRGGSEHAQDSGTGVEMVASSLTRIKAEARKAAQAYQRARMTWGLLGTAVRKQVQRIIEGLSPQGPLLQAGGLRKQSRRLTNSGTVVVFRLPHSWRQVAARIVDVSEDGVGLLLPSGLVNDLVEREMAGDVAARVGMILIVGLGAEPHRLWIPGEVVHCHSTGDGLIRAGIQFATPASQEMFDT